MLKVIKTSVVACRAAFKKELDGLEEYANTVKEFLRAKHQTPDGESGAEA